MLQLGYPLLELLDAQGLLAQLGAISLALGQQHRLQRLDIVGKRSIDSHDDIDAAIGGSGNDYRSTESPCRIGVCKAKRLNLPPVAATYAAAAASRCLPEDSPAAPA